MLPPMKRIREVTFGLLILCVSSGIVAAGLPQSTNAWHDGPINCYTCDSVEDCVESGGLLRKCENNDAQTCVVVFDGTGAVMQRGCSDAIAATNGAYCYTHAGYCPSCSSSGCNEATGLDQYFECVSCDSRHDPDCVLRPDAVNATKLCRGGCLTALYPSGTGTNAETTPTHHLARTCLDDLDLDDRLACMAAHNGQCASCTGAKCNVQPLPEMRNSCYHCVNDCEDQVAHECIAYSTDDQCYLQFTQSEGVVAMGCLSDFESASDVLALIKQKMLYVCEGSNCNGFESIPIPHDCATCRSDETETCATQPAASNAVERCSAIPYTQCYQRVDAERNGVTQRGCLADLDADVFYECLTQADGSCRVCSGNNCNTEIIPADRPRCQRCNSESDSRCHGLPAALGVCPSYDKNDSCVALYADGITRRACLSEFDCDATSKNCQKCRGDGCNTLNLKKQAEQLYGIFQDLPLNCYTCAGAECNESIGVVRKCEGDALQDCLSVFDESGAVVQRGCEDLVDAEYAAHCAAYPHLCFRCKANGCNVVMDASVAVQECLYCDAAAHPDCLLRTSAVSTTRRCVDGCVSALYERKTDPEVHDLVRTCFEDIELDDRDACITENNCVRCTDADGCNNQILPVKGRLSCLHCDSADCSALTSRPCLGYDTSDQCYMYFDNVTLSAVRMGCRSEFTRVQVAADIKQFFLCDGDNCNDFTSLPEANICYACNSATDVNCSVAPANLSVRNRCQTFPYTDCYTRITPAGHTERGCLQTLPTDVFVSCLDGAPNSLCRICTGTNCNGEIFPSGRQQCYFCNSSTNTHCASMLSATHAQPCPLYAPEDGCVTKLDAGGVTLRGCLSELECAGSSYKLCRECTGINCNDVDLIAIDIGPPGIFQELPLDCYNCRGSDKCATAGGYIGKCEGDHLQTCTTAFAANGSVVGRGCSDAMNELCWHSGAACYDCKSSGCNEATKETDYVDCVYCDARESDACIFNVSAVTRTRHCHKACMTALYARTTDPAPAYELIRTCVDDMDLNDRKTCIAGIDPSRCVVCTTPGCNTVAMGEHKSCYQCVGEQCQDPNARRCRATTDHEQCFFEYDEAGSVVRLGCKSDYDPAEVHLRVSAQRMWLCDENDCNQIANQPRAERCILCNSRSDPNCATAPDAIIGNTLCSRLPHTQCYSRIVDDGHTERGCLSSLDDDDFYACINGLNTTSCLACQGERCNNDLFPLTRRWCHICSSADSITCESSPKAQQVCPTYSPEERCVTTVTEQSVTLRGCSSALSCDPADGASCQFCDDDNCNRGNLRRKLDGRPGLWQPLPITCHSCAGVAGCKAATALTLCAEDSYCMTVFEAGSGEVIHRGCSDSVESVYGDYCDANSDNCYNCNSNKCNSATSLTDYVECIYCDLRTSGDCVAQPTAVSHRRKCHQNCMTALRLLPNSSAYELVRSCLDDKDVTEHAQCLEGNEKCVACDITGCNSEVLPLQRRSCLMCVGDACQQPASKLCQLYRPDDACFMLFDEFSDVTRLGCVSELSDEFVASNALSLYMCSGADDCNSFDKIPTPNLCVVCSSADDPQCATHPNKTTQAAQCSALPNTQCYTRITKEGHTIRGCVSNLSTVLRTSCLSGNATDCITCHSDICNTAIFPVDRRQCQRCNSKEDALCESTPAAESVCPMYTADDICSTKLVNGNTYRGCGSEFICDDTDKQFCRMCVSGDNCNIVNLVAGNIGYPGQWTTPPVNCFTCSGAANCEQPGVLSKCEGNELQNCATVFAANGSVIQRACSDKVYDDESNGQWCDAHPNLCKFCKSNGCNQPVSLDDFIECLHCDGAESADCVFAPHTVTRTRNCHGRCLTGLYPRSGEANAALELVRGCLDDLDLDDQIACANSEMAFCSACAGAECNAQLMPAIRLHCYHCAGADCEIKEESNVCRSFRPDDQCYTLFDGIENRVTSKGCASDWENENLYTQRRRLLLCDGNDCNAVANFPKSTGCSYCNSTIDRNCAINPSQLIISVVCEGFPHTECYTRVNQNGVTIRGCLSDVTDDIYDDCVSSDTGSCQVCAMNGCNTAVFPMHRRSCLRCDSIMDTDCGSSPEQYATICDTYHSDDACVTHLKGDHLLRGCASDLSCDEGETCRRCDSNNCNSIDLLAIDIGEPGKWQDLPLNCLVCEGNAECADGGGAVKKCVDKIMQTCMTVFDENGLVERRGCSDTVAVTHGAYCDTYANRCFGCKSNGCNDADSLGDYVDCYFCDSAESDDDACVIATTGLRRTRKCQTHCMVAMYPRSSANDSAYELSRSCLDDMDLDDRDACLNGERQHCVACAGDRCNTAAVPDQRHTCYKCAADGCENATPHQCNAYLADDQCYTLYDDKSSIIAMGCRSQFEKDVVEQLMRQKRLLLCDGPNCNDPAAAPLATICSVCDSADNQRCATNPNLVANIERCAAFPYTDCYTRITHDGRTERGCLAMLEEDVFFSCLLGADGLCETCAGDKCNQIDVFPANRMTCYQCSSDDNSLCGSSLDSSKVCPVYSGSDACVTNLRNGVTQRGCASSFSCDNPNDNRTCRVCSSAGCNSVVGRDGEPGRWQDVPISCYTCTGADDCASDTASPLHLCTDNPFQNCVTVFDTQTGAVVQRGCSDAIEAENAAYCSANAEYCLACNSNGCNDATTLEEYVQCWACDTDSGGACVNDIVALTKKRSCRHHCMVALYPLADEEDPAYGLTRSCLDDMDQDERDACADGFTKHCIACSTDNCNTAEMPAHRMRCNKCVGNECQLPQSTICATYRAKDHCYIRFDELHSVVAMGCRSELSNAEAEYLQRQQRLFLCEDDDCNAYEALPAAQTCKLCNSRTDIYCATRPDLVESSTKCAATPFTQCYSRILSDGATERGCLSSLYDNEFQGCLNGTTEYCEVCVGESCNAALYPISRPSCHICDSASNTGCENLPNNLTVCPKYATDDTCVTAFRDNVTYRGCSSSSAAWGCAASESNFKSCSTCRGNGCNTINLAKRQDDNYGMWQDLPLHCWTCDGESECTNAATWTAATCANNNEQDCMTVFNVVSDVVVRRGCTDIVEADYSAYCDKNAGSCFSCKSNECNSAMVREDYVNCVYCNSHKDPDCVWSPLNVKHRTRACHGDCMTALFPSDSSSSPGYDLIRSCLNDKDRAEQLMCIGDADANCLACAGGTCNVDDLPKDRMRCLICEGDACEDAKSTLCPLYKTDDQCFIWFDETNSVVKMGCASSLHMLDQETVIKTKRILLCDGPDCNTLDQLDLPQKCAVCNSSSDVNCAISASDISTYDTCTHQPYTSCFSKLNADGHTIRGCLAELPVDVFAACVLHTDANCETCKGDGCNREVFPAYRQQCHFCTTEDDINCESNPTKKRPCPVVNEREACVSALSGNVTVRGCSTEFKCDTSDSRTCRSCFGTGCNTIDLRNKIDDGYHGVWQPLPLHCHTCDGEQCLSSLGPALSCTRNSEQDCMTVFEEDGEVRRRGCSDDVDDYEDLYCRLHPHLCYTCKSNECNDVWDQRDFVECAFCDSLTDPLCVVNPENSGFPVRSCRKECMVTMHGQQVIRSCLDDKELFVHHECRTGNDKACAGCDQNGCNKFVLPDDRLSCHVCTGANCTNSYSQYCELYSEQDFCFAMYGSDHVELMGCGSSVNSSDIDDWMAQKKLYRCDGSDCNDLKKLPSPGICLSCDSSKSPNCAQNPTALTTTDTCPALSKECVTRTNSAGHTLRGCISALDQSELNCRANSTCAVCTGDKCNNEIYPANRRQCYICNSVVDEKCIKSPNESQRCPIYAINDRCVAKNTDGFIERGCFSELTCDASDTKYCQICDGDMCNIADVSAAAGLASCRFLMPLLIAAATLVHIRRL